MIAKKMFKNAVVLFGVFFLLMGCSAKQQSSFDPRLAATETGATTAYKRTLLTGGTFEALDSIDGAGLLANDFAFVLLGGTLYTYNYKNYGSAQTESSPDIIVADANPGTYAWKLQEQPGANVITSDTTLYLAVSGNDTTGDGTSSTPWYSLEKAFDYLKNKWINNDSTVTISVAAGTYTGLSTATIEHPCSSRIDIVGAGSGTTILQTSIITGSLIAVEGVTLKGLSAVTLKGDSFATGIALYGASIKEVNDVIIDYFDWGLLAEDNSFIYLNTCNIKNMGFDGIWARNSIASLNSVSFSGIGLSAIYAEDSSTIEAKLGSSTIASTTTGCLSFYNSFIDARNITTNTATTPYSPSATTGDTPAFGNRGAWIYKP